MAIQSSKSAKTLRRRSSSNLPGLWRMGFFRMRLRIVPFSAATNGK